MAAITKSYTGHSPSITVNWSYDPSTKKAKVEWTCGDGYFKFHYFEFYIFMRYKKGKGDWPVKLAAYEILVMIQVVGMIFGEIKKHKQLL